MSTDGNWRRSWRLILAATLVSSVGSGLTLPFLIVYLHAVRHLSLPVAGSVVAVSGLTGLVMGTLGGSLGDSVGLGRVLAAGLVVGALGTAGLAFVHTAAQAVLAVAAVGVGNAISWPALNGLIAANVPPAHRPRAFAVRFGILNAGLGVGGLVSGSVVSVHHPGTFQLMYGGEAATAMVFGLVVVVAARGQAGFKPVAAAGAGGRESGGYRAVFADRRFVAWLVCSGMFVLFGYAQLDGAWAAFATGVVHVDPQIVGIGFAANTGVIVVMQLGVAHLTRRWRRSRLLGVAGGCWAVAWALSGVSAAPALRGVPAEAALVASLAVFGFGETLYSPVSGSLPNDLAPDRLRGRYNALSSTVWSAGTLLGPPVAGLLLGSATPVAWAAASAGGCALAAVAGMGLARALPAAVERPPVPTAQPAPV